MQHIAAKDIEQYAHSLYQQLDNHIVIGIPIGIGKPTKLINALYHLAKQNKKYRLDIHTGLTLNVPPLKSELERRLLQPFFDRQFAEVPTLAFASDAKAGKLPKNVMVSEFYFKPGEMLRNPTSQQHYLSSNYTHVARDMFARGVNVAAQIVAHEPDPQGNDCYSLSCNPDVTLRLQELMRNATAIDGKTRLMIGEVNLELPFMPNDAEVPSHFFDTMIGPTDHREALFATPSQPISPADHVIGTYTSALIKDGGTLQIGIGSLGDAVVSALISRQQQPDKYRALLSSVNTLERFPIVAQEGGQDSFNEGLYGNTEMLVPGYLALQQHRILKRSVVDDTDLQCLINQGLNPQQLKVRWLLDLVNQQRLQPELSNADLDWLKHWGLMPEDSLISGNRLVFNGHSELNDLHNQHTQDKINQWLNDRALHHQRLIHAGFYVGSHAFYQQLKSMSSAERLAINMTSVCYTNQLAGNESLKRAQRQHARFINAAMKVTLTGAAVSDGLADGKVVSGVGGQFNFVNMAHELDNARSILMLRATRQKQGKLVSNIVFNYGHTTIPRHLRDIVVTEYGIADLRSRTDEEVIDALLRITDSRFQSSLIKQAKRAGKLSKHYKLPASARHNTPDQLAKQVAPFRDLLPTFPFGSELNDQELRIAGALKRLKAAAERKWPLLLMLIKKLPHELTDTQKADLIRLDLLQPRRWKLRLLRRLVLSVLR